MRVEAGVGKDLMELGWFAKLIVRVFEIIGGEGVWEEDVETIP